MSDDAAPAPSGTRRDSPLAVPPLLADLAGWTWRLLLLALAAYLTVRVLDILYFVVLPFVGALFATSLGMPLVRFLRKHRWPRAAATWMTVILAGLVFGGMFVFVVDRAIAEYPDLVGQVQHSVNSFRDFVVRDLHVKSSSTSSITTTITNYLQSHSSAVASGALSGIATVGEALAAFVLWFFITFFLLYDGDNIWDFVVGLFPVTARHRVQGAGEQAWSRLAGFVRGTFIIALFHGVVVAITLTILGVPLVAPLALLVFLGSFLPIVGAFLFGGLAVAVTLVTHGLIPGIILTVVLLIDNQIEAHIFQPFLVGRYVRLHPLAVAFAIAGGGLLEGIYGAILAVPFVAVVYAVLRYLFTGEDDDSATGDADPDTDEEPPAASEKLVPETG